jgi:predicted AlkP superfamily pyrophosphatase or phosphodiesterase
VGRGRIQVTLTRRGFLAALLACTLAACREAPPPPAERAILLLISIDGFRWDYLDKFKPPTLMRLAAEGVQADGLIPQFPSKTFPNHYTIVTGLTLAHHGIISNNMRDSEIPGEFSLSNRDVQSDPRWWGGEPIWNTAETQGRIAGAMFWPGSETVIGGRQATYWTPFEDDMPHAERVNRVLGWLKLPEETRPSFLTLYFSDVDSAGHSWGPDSAEVKNAVMRVDASLGELVAGVKTAGLDDRVHYVLVSDHGMAALSPDRVIVVDDYIDVTTADIVDWSPVLALTPKDGDVDTMYAALKDKHPALAVYRSRELPPEFGLTGHPRLPAIFALAKEGWSIASKRDVQRWGDPDRHPPGGTHGYDAGARSMHGLFIANGPRIRRGLKVKPFENIHVYEFMCAVLGLRPAKNDGDPGVTRDMLRSIR